MIGMGVDSCQLKREGFVAKTLAESGFPFIVQPPLYSRPTTADDKAPAANYPADGESLKCDCQSKGWPLCLQWDISAADWGIKEVELQVQVVL